MKCSSIEKQIDAFINNTLDKKHVSLIKQHLKECPGCAQKITTHAKLTTLLTTLPLPEMNSRQWDTLHESILRALPSTPQYHTRIGGNLISTITAKTNIIKAVAALIVISLVTYALILFTGFNRSVPLVADKSGILPKIVAVDGSAFTLSENHSTNPVQQPVKNDFQITPGAMVHTNSNSSLEVQVDERSKIRIQQNSQFSFSDYTEQKTVVKLNSGGLSAQVSKRKPEQLFRIETPNAFCEVVGTRFNVTTYQDGVHEQFITTLIVDEGIVKFGTGKRYIPVREGSAIAIFGDSLGSIVTSSDPVIRELLHQSNRGHYIITSLPSDADVIIDGIPSGKTPLFNNISTGSHSVTIDKKGYKSWSGTMDIAPNKKISMDIQLSSDKIAKENISYYNSFRHPVLLSAIDQINSGRYKEALEKLSLLEKSTTISRVTRAEALNKASICLKNIGEYSAAADKLQEIIIGDYPKNQRGFALFQKATINKTLLHDSKKAISDFRSYVHDFKDGIWIEEATFSLAELLQISNQFGEAAVMYKQYCDYFKKAAQHETALYRLGTIYSRNLSDFNNARNTFTRLLQEYPDSRHTEDVVFWSADCLLRQGYANSALQEFNNYIQQYPDGKWRIEVATRLKKIETAEVK